MKKWIVQKDNEICRDCGKEIPQDSYVWVDENEEIVCRKEISQGSYVWLDETEEIVCLECFFTEDEMEMLG